EVARREAQHVADQRFGGAGSALDVDLAEAHLEALDDADGDLGALAILAEAHVRLHASVEITALLVELGHARHRLFEPEIAEGLAAREPGDLKELAIADHLVSPQHHAV